MSESSTEDSSEESEEEEGGEEGVWVEKKVQQDADGAFVGPTQEIRVQAVTSMKASVSPLVHCRSIEQSLILCLIISVCCYQLWPCSTAG